MAVSELKKGPGGAFLCPVCGEELEFADGGQVRVVGGVVDFDNVKPRHICRRCGKFYRELLNTGYYDVFALEPEDEKPVEEVKQEPVQQEKPAESEEQMKIFAVSLTVMSLLTAGQYGW